MMKRPQKITILKQELSLIICTVDTIGTIFKVESYKEMYLAKSKTFLTQALMSL